MKDGETRLRTMQERLIHGYYIFFYVMAAWLWVMFDVDEAHFKETLNFLNQKCDGERNQKNSLFRKSFNCI